MSVKMTELAEELGVSVATISNALTGKGRMRDDKRKMIMEAAAARGYDFSKVSPRQKKKRVNIITEETDCDFCAKILAGICHEAEANGIYPAIYNLNLVERTDPYNPNPALLHMPLGNILNDITINTHGLIYVAEYPREMMKIIPRLAVPTVYAYCHTTSSVPFVHYDDSQGAYLATKHLTNQGKRNVAMISGPVNSFSMVKRMEGYQHALLESGISYDPRLVKIGDWKVEPGFQLMNELLDSPIKPDAVFCQSDTIAVGAMKAIRDRGLSIPQDIAVVGFDDSPYAQMLTPSLTTVVPPCYNIGREAFSLLWKLMNRTDDSDIQRRIWLPCTLTVRESSLETY